MRKTIAVLDDAGKRDCEVVREVAEELVRRGTYRWWNHARQIRPITVRPSEKSNAALGAPDAEALAGARHLSSQRRERLAGWGLDTASRLGRPAISVACPECGAKAGFPCRGLAAQSLRYKHLSRKKAARGQ